MKCMICSSKMNYYFSKTYTETPFDEFMQKVGEVDYYKCSSCGFTQSKTHSELDECTWNELNTQFHHYLENPDYKKNINQPPYAEQAMMLAILGKNDIIKTGSMLDYAAGYGTLSNILAKYHGLNLSIYDPYVKSDSSSRYIDRVELKTYDTVINSAMFEHVLTRDSLDQVNNLVAENGCLIIHTLICENIPNDSNWFYLQPPVHTAFHTNKSMEILMRQWNYNSSIYCPKSKCWVLIKENINDIEIKLARINQELQTDWFIFKKGFVDFWKGF
ncbi:hypothetical protein B9Z36_12475 [Limnohabitans sp. Rim8]|uniref:methyltransferase domain-containing protein n=1 Tax=Limnohabitans sp. Rim8 TaxID=1100718 RepID=UPI000D3BBEA0|nr:methyltransferase domain-containing protein [Limnohabitans sp. Rim8]PUE54814.1 hypothetical protein B9Z36_12475 [Limnohabitans sp. Rim8]